MRFSQEFVKNDDQNVPVSSGNLRQKKNPPQKKNNNRKCQI